MSAGRAKDRSDTPNVLPRPDFHFPGEIGRTYLESDPAQVSRNLWRPPRARRISCSFLIDDCGFGQFGTFGGGIPSPTMDRLAAEGFATTAFTRRRFAVRRARR